MPLKGPHLGSETTGRKTPQRGRLSDITNTAPHSLSKQHRDDDHVSKACEPQVHKELANLRKALAEKEELIQAQKVNMEKLWTNYTKKTMQNEEIIEQNGRLYKELIQARDKLKILQHENAQMASAHKVIKSELQVKLANALEQADPFLKTAVPLTNEKGTWDKQANAPNVLAKLAESRARRTVSLGEASNDLFDAAKQDRSEHSAPCRSTLRRRASLSYKEPSLKTKMRQRESSTSQVRPCLNRQESRIQELHKVCEEEPNTAPASMPCSSEDKVAEISIPPCSQAAPQTKSSYSFTVSDDVSEGQNPTSSGVDEVNTFGIGLKSTELPRGRSGRRSAVGSVVSYKETPLNTKMRQE